MNGDGVLMNSNRWHLQTEGRVYSDNSGVANGDHQDERDSNQNGSAMDGGCSIHLLWVMSCVRDQEMDSCHHQTRASLCLHQCRLYSV